MLQINPALKFQNYNLKKFDNKKNSLSFGKQNIASASMAESQETTLLENKLTHNNDFSQVGLTVTKFGTNNHAESYVKYNGNVKEKDLILVQSTKENPNDSLMQLFIAANTAKRNGAKKITAVLPNYYYGRQDKEIAKGEGVAAKTVANLIEKSGIDELVVVEPHFPQIDGFFNIPIKKVSTINVLADKMKKELNDNNIKMDDVVVVSPDAGARKNNDKFAEALGVENVVTIHKQRTNINGKSEAKPISISKIPPNAKTAVIFDDIFDSGSTLLKGINFLRENAPNIDKVYICAAHGFFKNNAYQKINDNNDIKKVFVTNTVPLREGAPKKIEQVDISGVIKDSLE